MVYSLCFKINLGQWVSVLEQVFHLPHSRSCRYASELINDRIDTLELLRQAILEKMLKGVCTGDILRIRAEFVKIGYPSRLD